MLKYLHRGLLAFTALAGAALVAHAATINITQGSGTPFLTYQDGSSNNFSAIGITGLTATNQADVTSTHSLLTDESTSSQLHTDLTAATPAGTNAIGTVQFSPTQTMHDCSATLTANTATSLIAASTVVHGFMLQNNDTTHNAPLWFSVTTTATTGPAAQMFEIAEAGTNTLPTNNPPAFVSPPGMGINSALSVISTAALVVPCTYW